MLITNNYDIAGNTNEAVIHIPKLRVGRYLFFIQYQLVFKNFTNLQCILEIKKEICSSKKTEILKFWKLKFNKEESN